MKKTSILTILLLTAIASTAQLNFKLDLGGGKDMADPAGWNIRTQTYFSASFGYTYEWKYAVKPRTEFGFRLPIERHSQSFTYVYYGFGGVVNINKNVWIDLLGGPTFVSNLPKIDRQYFPETGEYKMISNGYPEKYAWEWQASTKVGWKYLYGSYSRCKLSNFFTVGALFDIGKED